MQIVGIKERIGEYEKKPYTNYYLTVLVSQDEYGIHCKNLKIKGSKMAQILKNHKMTEYKQLLKFDYNMEYYDSYNNLVDLA